MLQRDPSQVQVPYEIDEPGPGPAHYYQILRKRIFYLVVPFLIVFAIGFAGAMLWPPTYLSEGKILVESQQIPTDLVRPTVTATAAERIQVIQQRVLTRDNLLAVMDKYQVYANRRESLSRTELLDLMRENTHIDPVELDQQRRRNEAVTIALRVGFTDRRPDIATKVANELLTLFLNEDARNRTNRAMETTKFLAREVQRLEGELGSVETKLAEAKRQQRTNPTLQPAAGQPSPLVALKTELAAKLAVYSKSHPDVKRLKAQIESLEKMDLPAAPTTSAPTTQVDTEALDALQTQRDSLQKALEAANQKLAAARLGESLERDQFSERLEVLEQAIPPQKPIKPNRPKIIAAVFFAAVMAGLACIFAVETFDRTIRGSQDLLRVADGHLIVTIPYIATQAELVRKKSHFKLVAAITAAVLLGGLAIVHFLVRPLDDLWGIFLVRLLGSLH